MARIGKWRSAPQRARAALSAAGIMASAVAVFAAVSAITSGFGVSRKDKQVFPEGTRVEGISIEGLTEKAALKLIEEGAEARIAHYSCTVRLPGRDDWPIVFTAEDYPVSVDPDATLAEAASGGNNAFVMRFDEDAVRSAARSASAAALTEPVQPSVGFSKERVPAGQRFWRIPGIDGSELDVEQCVRLITSGKREFDAPMRVIPFDEEPCQMLPELIGSFETSFAEGSLAAKNRVWNIVRAAELINGTVVGPQSTFSCNAVLGRRTEENGWRKAPGITRRGAGTEDQPGGGVCQASTTLFNAALLADMDIVYRQAHSRPIAYCEPGRDSAIDTDSIDLVWKNPNDEPVYVFMWADEENKTLLCEIYGTQETRSSVEIETVLVSVTEPANDEYVLDTTLQPDAVIEDNPAITGYVYKTYRIHKENGREISREYVGESVYRMHPRRFRAGAEAYAKAMGGQI